MPRLITQTPVPFGAEIPVDPAIMLTLNRWSTPKHPIQSKSFRAQVERLCKQLETPPAVQIENIEFSDDPVEIERSRENARYWLEFVRSTLVFIEGVTLERIQREVRKYVPYMAARLRLAVEHAKSALIESEQSLLFILDESVENEWLPEPAPPGSFDRSADAVPLELP